MSGTWFIALYNCKTIIARNIKITPLRLYNKKLNIDMSANSTTLFGKAPNIPERNKMVMLSIIMLKFTNW